MRFAKHARFALPLLALVIAACVRDRPYPASVVPSPVKVEPSGFAKVVAVGDIADCPQNQHFRTAKLVDEIRPDAVLALGDLAYLNASKSDFLDCYHPAWGKFRSITRATPGNHEFHSTSADPYFNYMRGASGEGPGGYHSFDVGAWHVVALNSSCDVFDTPSKFMFGGCGKDSPQARWLKEDLAKHPAKCTAAIWHHPVFNSGPHGEATHMHDLWKILEDAGADLVLTGHVHEYERFAPMVLPGVRDDKRGMRQFVVGTGGRGLTGFKGKPRAHSESIQATAHGVLELEFHESKYKWKYVPVDGDFRDSGEADCHF